MMLVSRLLMSCESRFRTPSPTSRPNLRSALVWLGVSVPVTQKFPTRMDCFVNSSGARWASSESGSARISTKAIASARWDIRVRLQAKGGFPDLYKVPPCAPGGFSTRLWHISHLWALIFARNDKTLEDPLSSSEVCHASLYGGITGSRSS